jgi:hypothetical protein
MGLLDKLTQVGQAITGGAADIWIEYPRRVLRVGERIKVRVTIQSTGYAVESRGVFVDIKAEEKGTVRDGGELTSVHNKTLDKSYPLSPPLVLGANERRAVDGIIQIPNGEPTYYGSIDHRWLIRGRLEASGNDPDTGYYEIIVSKY